MANRLRMVCQNGDLLGLPAGVMSQPELHTIFVRLPRSRRRPACAEALVGNSSEWDNLQAALTYRRHFVLSNRRSGNHEPFSAEDGQCIVAVPQFTRDQPRLHSAFSRIYLPVPQFRRRKCQPKSMVNIAPFERKELRQPHIAIDEQTARGGSEGDGYVSEMSSLRQECGHRESCGPTW